MVAILLLLSRQNSEENAMFVYLPQGHEDRAIAPPPFGSSEDEAGKEGEPGEAAAGQWAAEPRETLLSPVKTCPHFPQGSLGVPLSLKE